MRKIKATIVYPIEIEVEVPIGSSVDDIWNKLVTTGDETIQAAVPAPVIYSCSEPELTNRGQDKEHLAPETQADFVLAATQGLLKALENIMPAVSALPFLGSIKTSDGLSLGTKIMEAQNKLSLLITDLISATNPIPKE